MSDDIVASPWYRREVFQVADFCGETTELNRAEQRFIAAAPGFIPVWALGMSEDRDDNWLMCPLTPGHRGGHGTFLGYPRGRSRTYAPGSVQATLDSAVHWCLHWGPDGSEKRLITTRQPCGQSDPGTGVDGFENVVEGSRDCMLWLDHEGQCKKEFVETLDFDFSESEIEVALARSTDSARDQGGEHQEADLDDVESWHLEELARHGAAILAGDLSVQEVIQECYYSRSEIVSWIAHHTTQEERKMARRVRRHRLATWRAAADIYLAAEKARQQAVAAS